MPLIDVGLVSCFNPAPEVIESITELARHVGALIVVDDGSTDLAADFYDSVSAVSNVHVVVSVMNRGLAHALNIGFARASDSGARTIVTFDQDARISEALVRRLAESVRELDGVAWGVVGPGIVNGIRYESEGRRGLRPTFEVIQSGAVFNLDALRRCGFADETLFIDSVDTDLCLRLRSHGFGVFLDDRIEMTHPIGSGRTVQLLGKHLAVTNHSADRRYYMTRNKLELLRRYGRRERVWAVRASFWLFVSVVASVTMADHRLATLRATGRGVGDFLRRRSGPDGRPRLGPGSTPGIAVVMVTHNGAAHLREQLESILTQTELPTELFLVDDQSTDGSKELVVGFFETDGRVEVTVVNPSPNRHRDLYTRIARNFSAGLRAASSYEYIALADQDDVWEPDRLERQRGRLRRFDCLMTVGNGLLIDRSGVLSGQTLRDRFPVIDDWDSASPERRLSSVLRQSMATGAASMIHRRILEMALPIPAGWLHDRWLSLVGVAAGGLDVDNGAVLRYRVYPQQVVGLRGRTYVPPRVRIAGGIRRPYSTVRKFYDVAFALRRSTGNRRINVRTVGQAYLRPAG